jgi:hypothetical protein
VRVFSWNKRYYTGTAVFCMLAALCAGCYLTICRYIERSRYCQELLELAQTNLTIDTFLIGLRRECGSYAVKTGDNSSIWIFIGDKELQRWDQLQADARKDVGLWEERIAALKSLRMHFWEPIPLRFRATITRHPNNTQTIVWPDEPRQSPSGSPSGQAL